MMAHMNDQSLYRCVSPGRLYRFSTSSSNGWRIMPRRKVTSAAVRARWCIDIRYGRKLEAVSLLQEWVTNIGSEASPPLNASNTRINSGAIGAPESRLELEITLETLAELEQFWATIPPEAHKHWSQRMNPCLMDGSPTWEVFRTVDVFPESEVGISQDTNIERKEASSYPRIMEITDESDIEKYGQSMDQNPPLGSKTKTTPSGLSVVTDEDDVETILDWKGDPMKIRPGDKLPFKFQ